MTIFKWEMGKIISNWRRTMVIFLMPAVLLLGALNIFPLLINYLSTGHLQSNPVIVINAPESFVDFVSTSSTSNNFSYTFYSTDELEEELDDDEDFLDKKIRSGALMIRFSAKDENGEPADFDECVKKYFNGMARGSAPENVRTAMRVGFNANNYTSYIMAEQYLLNIESSYKEYLFDELGEAYKEVGGGSRWKIDDFNPYTYVMKNRANANYGASRTIPAIMILLMYYCVYSLSGEILAASRESGFLTKVYLTPISEVSLLSGKMLTVVTVSTISAALTYLLLFFSSWLNRSNSAFSLLPFGMFLTPLQLLFTLLTLVVTSFVMCALCFGIVFQLRRMEDVLLNLQIPLVLLIIEFFAQMFRPTTAVFIEYLIPIHNGIMVVRDIFLGTLHVGDLLITILINAGVTVIMIALCIRNTDGMIHISQGGDDDTGKPGK